MLTKLFIMVSFSSVSNRQQHYSGAKHSKRVRACLEEWSKKNPGERKNKDKGDKQRNKSNKQTSYGNKNKQKNKQTGMKQK